MKPSSAYPSPEEFCYPVKRRGERRRLNPNQAGIAWLEEQSDTDTEIASTYETGEPAEDGQYEFVVHRALGWHSARQRGMYPWPMFQVISGFKASRFSYPRPCPACDDWSRTSQCADHHDRDGVAGLAMGYQRQQARYAQAYSPSQAGRLVPPRVPNAIMDSYNEAARRTNDAMQYSRSSRPRTVRPYGRCTCSYCGAVWGDPGPTPGSATVEMTGQDGEAIVIEMNIESPG